MNRLERIRYYSAVIKEEKKRETKVKDDLRNELVHKIQDLQPRIQEIIKTANACYNNGINIENYGYGGNDYSGGYEKGQFLTEGIYHRVGIVKQPYDVKEISLHYKYMGITNGGACGIYDFRTDGVEVFSFKQDDCYEDKTKYEPQIRDMKEFLKDFDTFERSFYEYIDKTLDEKVPNEDEPDITEGM